MFMMLNNLLIPWQAKSAAVLAVCGAILWLGHSWGADGVQEAWDKEKNLATIAQLDMQIEWQKKSADYQAQLAAMQRKVQSNRKEVQNAIRFTYSSCVADNRIVRLWRDSFLVEQAPR